MKIERLTFIFGMIDRLKDIEKCPRFVLGGDEIPKNIIRLIEKERLTELSGQYGDPDAGTPIQYEELTIDSGERTIIICYNRGIAMFMTDDERLTRIHRVMVVLEDFFEGRAR